MRLLGVLVLAALVSSAGCSSEEASQLAAAAPHASAATADVKDCESVQLLAVFVEFLQDDDGPKWTPQAKVENGVALMDCDLNGGTIHLEVKNDAIYLAELSYQISPGGSPAGDAKALGARFLAAIVPKLIGQKLPECERGFSELTKLAVSLAENYAADRLGECWLYVDSDFCAVRVRADGSRGVIQIAADDFGEAPIGD